MVIVVCDQKNEFGSKKLMFLWCFSLVLIVIAVAVIVSIKQVISIAVVSCMLPSVVVVIYLAYALCNTIVIVV